jgi:hypothetical protein
MNLKKEDEPERPPSRYPFKIRSVVNKTLRVSLSVIGIAIFAVSFNWVAHSKEGFWLFLILAIAANTATTIGLWYLYQCLKVPRKAVVIKR